MVTAGNAPRRLLSGEMLCARRRCSRTYSISIPRFTISTGIANRNPRGGADAAPLGRPLMV